MSAEWGRQTWMKRMSFVRSHCFSCHISSGCCVCVCLSPLLWSLYYYTTHTQYIYGMDFLRQKCILCSGCGCSISGLLFQRFRAAKMFVQLSKRRWSVNLNWLLLCCMMYVVVHNHKLPFTVFFFYFAPLFRCERRWDISTCEHLLYVAFHMRIDFGMKWTTLFEQTVDGWVHSLPFRRHCEDCSCWK